ncbi:MULTISPECIES: thioredoxin family protein [Sphingobacterium]|uniref:thioredoxin family protein n=1 Tax=Sphingobacterium TaxID=28453 RepID=UPI0013DCD273|nr:MULTISPECIES: thioredoxin family protein [unclassified Sphingobacterium]
MKKLSILILFFTIFKVSAQEEIEFISTENWKKITERAALEDKLIFVDCYTSWCAPCKWMEKNVFTDSSVATFYNDKFINVKIDMEKGEGVILRKQYNVQSFPTFLFVNSKGEVIHRTGSKMSVEDFLREGMTAADPKKNVSYLKQKYEKGQRDINFLLDFYLAVQKSDRSMAQKLGLDIIKHISEQELNTELGWRVIKNLALTENDKLGKHFLANQEKYTLWSSKEDRHGVEERLITSTMNNYISLQDESAFFNKLPYFKKSSYAETRKQGVMLESDFYLSLGKFQEFKKLTSSAMKNELKNDADKLSFLARRIARGSYQKIDTNPMIMQQAYIMAKQASLLEPEEYSIQGTYANVCLELKKKDEGLKAAKKARELANAETSKIQRIADDLIRALEAL